MLSELTRHGYVVVFLWVTAEMLGAPVPAVPILLAAGVLTATGHLSFSAALALAVLGCLIGDTAWYAIGKKWGTTVLRILCKISLEPESCVRRGSDLVSRHGSRTLLVAKFVPGISAVAVPLTANSGTTLPTFLLYDVLGSIFYAATYLAAGRLIGGRIDRLAAVAHSVSSASIALAVLGAVAVVGHRYEQRRKFRRLVRTSRITPQELRDLIESGQNPFIVDLRHPLDMLTDPRVIPGAMRLTPDQLTATESAIPLDREIILYCT
jgi:membrane protein DedA with SNARE-associated domain